jgi:hypothetical protein
MFHFDSFIYLKLEILDIEKSFELDGSISEKGRRLYNVWATDTSSVTTQSSVTYRSSSQPATKN